MVPRIGAGGADGVNDVKLAVADESKILNSIESVPCIDSEQFAKLLIEGKRKPLPDASTMFPWLYGDMPEISALQEYGFGTCNGPPKKSVGLLLVVCGDASIFNYEIKGTIHAKDILKSNGSSYSTDFLYHAQTSNFSIRNFQMQSAKFAECSDIVVYVPEISGQHEEDRNKRIADAHEVAHQLRKAQINISSPCITLFYPFLVSEVAKKFDDVSKALIFMNLIRSKAPQFCEAQNWDSEMPSTELAKLHAMTKALEIAPNVWLGNSLDAIEAQHPQSISIREVYRSSPTHTRSKEYNLHVDCDYSCTQFPPLEDILDDNNCLKSLDDIHIKNEISFPTGICSSGMELNPARAAYFVNLCYLIHLKSRLGAVLITCYEGYRGSSFLAIMYLIYSRAQPIDDAMIYLHSQLKREFSVDPEVVKYLYHLQADLIKASPVTLKIQPRIGFKPHELQKIDRVLVNTQAWALDFSGSFPSRILPYLYLGSYQHAQNKGMLAALGIRRMVSLGECPYPANEASGKNSGFDKILHIPGFFDSGASSLFDHLGKCLKFLEYSRSHSIPTLVHCHHGVSRSVSVCIAEIMKSTKCSLPEAFLTTRVKRLDILVQPNLRFMYELLVFEESLAIQPGRSIEWPVLCREITILNRNYTT